MKSSSGRETRHSCKTVRPPTPESNIAIGSDVSSALPLAGRSVRALQEGLVGHEEDRYDHDQPGDRADLAEPLRNGHELRTKLIARLEITFRKRPSLPHLGLEEAVLEAEEHDDC